MTVPLALDLALLPVALAGSGPALVKRLTFLDGERVPGLTVYAPDPAPALARAAGGRLIPRLPTDDEIAACRLLFVAGLPFAQSAELAALARNHGVLVNVEDTLLLCDFHVPAVLRRGELAISISTGGSSPTLARRLRTYLGDLLPPEWSDRIARIATLREDMRARGAGMAEVTRATDALIDKEGWLPPSL
ncbi:MAG: siroheme synthase [Rhodospirillales bacterium]|nr:siroheme synthase [Rhodospirillales bacterium]